MVITEFDQSSTNAMAASQEATREAFYQRAGKRDLAPLWRVLKGLVGPSPSSPAKPAIWRYEEVRSFLLEACELIGTEEADRRVLMLENPGLSGESKITRSLYAGLQVILPGEYARPHRHIASALRFVIEGVGAWTSVDGERTDMKPGDFVVTPSWTWHEHGNEGNGPVVWLDGLDVHIVNLFDAGFREDHGERPLQVSRPVGASTAEFALNLLPMDADSSRTTSPIFNYPYDRTREALHGVSRDRPIDRHHGFKLRYANPLNGDWAIATIATWAQFLPEGFDTAAARSTDGAIYVVVEGEGASSVGEKRLEWKKGDIFVVPSWTPVSHYPQSDAVLFGASDRVVQEKLGFWRELRE